jgi:hypothetical protein
MIHHPRRRFGAGAIAAAVLSLALAARSAPQAGRRHLHER